MKKTLILSFVIFLLFSGTYSVCPAEGKAVSSTYTEVILEDFFFASLRGSYRSDVAMLDYEMFLTTVSEVYSKKAMATLASGVNMAVDIGGIAQDLRNENYSYAAIGSAKLLAGFAISAKGVVSAFPWCIALNGIAFSAKKTVDSFEAVEKEIRETDLLLLLAQAEKDGGLERETLWTEGNTESKSQFFKLRRIINNEKNKKYIYENYLKPTDRQQTPVNDKMVRYGKVYKIDLLIDEKEYKPKGIKSYFAILKQIGDRKADDLEWYPSLTEKDKVEFDLTPNDKRDDDYLTIKAKPAPGQEEVIEIEYKRCLAKRSAELEKHRNILVGRLIADVNKDIQARKEYYELITRIKEAEANGELAKVRAWGRMTDYMLKKIDEFNTGNTALINNYSPLLGIIRSDDPEEAFIDGNVMVQKINDSFESIKTNYRQKNTDGMMMGISSKNLARVGVEGSINAGFKELEDPEKISLKEISASIRDINTMKGNTPAERLTIAVGIAINDIKTYGKGVIHKWKAVRGDELESLLAELEEFYSKRKPSGEGEPAGSSEMQLHTGDELEIHTAIVDWKKTVTVHNRTLDGDFSKDHTKKGAPKLYFILEDDEMRVLKIDGEMFWAPINPPQDEPDAPTPETVLPALEGNQSTYMVTERMNWAKAWLEYQDIRIKHQEALLKTKGLIGNAANNFGKAEYAEVRRCGKLIEPARYKYGLAQDAFMNYRKNIQKDAPIWLLAIKKATDLTQEDEYALYLYAAKKRDPRNKMTSRLQALLKGDNTVTLPEYKAFVIETHNLMVDALFNLEDPPLDNYPPAMEGKTKVFLDNPMWKLKYWQEYEGGHIYVVGYYHTKAGKKVDYRSEPMHKYVTNPEQGMIAAPSGTGYHIYAAEPSKWDTHWEGTMIITQMKEDKVKVIHRLKTWGISHYPKFTGSSWVLEYIESDQVNQKGAAKRIVLE